MESIFNALFSAESDAIFRFCMIHVSDREQALDITQETFLRLWKKIQERTKIENARAFLYKVSHNMIIDWYRKKKAVPLKSYGDEDSDEAADETIKDGEVTDDDELEDADITGAGDDDDDEEEKIEE